jgi:hypothetical protein
MNQDSELDLFRTQVNCAAVLENMGKPWRLDKSESTRRALKYETVQNLGVITPHFETDDAPIAPRRRNPC